MSRLTNLEARMDRIEALLSQLDPHELALHLKDELESLGTTKLREHPPQEGKKVRGEQLGDKN